jgi:hypothetical protein
MDRMKTEAYRMSQRRSILIHGLSIALRRLPAFLWTYVFNLALAFLFSIPLKLKLSAILDHSLAAQRLSSGFDLSTAGESFYHLSNTPGGSSSAASGGLSVLFFFILYFVLVPGTLFCYLTHTRARLGTLLRRGLFHFWRFVRITIVALIVYAIILGPLSALQRRWADYIDDRMVGRSALILTLVGLGVVFLVASLLRLYFDLVEVYTVQLGTMLLPNGKPDRRVRRTFRPAFRTLRTNFLRAWFVFLLLAVLGVAALYFSARTAMHMLAQPRVWPMFLLAQAGLFFMLFTRFWQRGAEVSLALQNPIPPNPALVDTTPTVYRSSPNPPPPPPTPSERPISPDPIPNPEPASPSLDQPDPGVFHHDPQKPQS